MYQVLRINTTIQLLPSLSGIHSALSTFSSNLQFDRINNVGVGMENVQSVWQNLIIISYLNACKCHCNTKSLVDWLDEALVMCIKLFMVFVPLILCVGGYTISFVPI